MKLAIFGSGSLGKEILSVVRNEKIIERWDEIVFADDISCASYICGIKKYNFSEIKELYGPEDVEFVIATGEPKYREKLHRMIVGEGYNLTSIISSTAYVGERSIISDGSIVFPNVYISNDVCIERNCIVHANSKIESECRIGSNSFISSGAFVGANSNIGCNVFVGPNAALFDHIELLDNCIVGIGSVVLKNVGDSEVVVGNPAKRIINNGRVFKAEYCLVDDEKL